jgi:lipopolysaccharide transport system ATP-binding protein
VVGLIGRNGAGKSTLLKVISRITFPTSGRLELRGQVSSLLEVGTGFHPELSGRENIYLNGTILGMRRREIDRKFDEIIDFSGVEKFIDTPIKRYSTGMRVRLAFSVAAHLEPEILLVDEVLSVGDALFQKKSLGKMKSVAQQGRTVLFVSHQMDAVRALCSRAILLADGQVAADGETDPIVNRYMEIAKEDIQGSLWRGAGILGSEDQGMTLLSISVQDSDGNIKGEFEETEAIHISISYRLDKEFHSLGLKLRLLNEKGSIAITTSDSLETAESRGPGEYTSACAIPAGTLNQAEYTVYTWGQISNGPLLTTRNRAYISFFVKNAPKAASSRELYLGVINPNLPKWTLSASQ